MDVCVSTYQQVKKTRTVVLVFKGQNSWQGTNLVPEPVFLSNG